MFGRIFATLGAFVAYGTAMAFFTPQAMLITGKAAAQQLKNSDDAYIHAMYTFSFFSGINMLLSFLLLVALIAIWAQPIRRALNNINAQMVIIGGALILPMLLFGTGRADAYYAKTDGIDAYTILPNETAIMVPSVGANGAPDTQVQMDSEEYLKSKQVASKMITVPHITMNVPNSWFSGYIVPSARLFIVDRTTYSHEWVGKGRGTDPNTDEAIHCQSKEGLDITVGIAVGAGVKEEDAAKFLYNFGVAINPKADRTNPEVIFQSVYYSRKVADVMSDTGRKAIQTITCNQIFARNFDAANAEAPLMMTNIKKEATDYLATLGITLKFIGWADTFTFSEGVQKAVDDKYIANSLGPVIATLNAITNLKVQEGVATGLDKHGFPMVIGTDFLNAIQGIAARPPAPVLADPPPAGPRVTESPVKK